MEIKELFQRLLDEVTALHRAKEILQAKASPEWKLVVEEKGDPSTGLGGTSAEEIWQAIKEKLKKPTPQKRRR